MIQLQDIQKQAQGLYPRFLKAILKNETFFPQDIRFGKIKAKETLKNFSELHDQVQNLRAHSKEKLGYGYQIQFATRKDQKIGAQAFPQRIFFENQRDYLKFLKKEKEFQKFKTSLTLIEQSLPELLTWAQENPLKIIQYAGQWPSLLKVGAYFKNNPKPNLYVRELPIEVPTKFIENHQGILRSLLDFLNAKTLNAQERIFEKRFHLKFAEALIRLRILDPKISQTQFSGLSDLTIPQSEFNKLKLDCTRVFILENKTNFTNLFNFLTLPQMNQAIAIFGKGFGLGLLKEAQWLKDKKIYYWGDIDAQGFQILSQLRSYLPQTESFLMDRKTFECFPEYRVAGTPTQIHKLSNLNPDESELLSHLLALKEKNRLEQEKIPQSYVVEVMKILFYSTTPKPFKMA